MAAESLTVGVEEEFLLADRESGAPIAANVAVAGSARRAGLAVQLELSACQIETSTGVHTSTADLLVELHGLRERVSECASADGARLLAVAIPPTVPEPLPVTDLPRYRRIADAYGMLAQEQGLCGAHVHVGVPDREAAVQVSNHLRPWLPTLLATTANSAVYRARDTGYASWRSILWQRVPSAGPPPYLSSVAEYEDMVEVMRAAGSILDPRMVYWDIRPSENFPTVEVRVSDVPATATESALLGALVRAAVTTALDAVAGHRPAPPVPAQVLRAAYWSAAHAGLDGDGLDPVARRVVPHRTMLAWLVRAVEPALRQAGDLEFVRTAIEGLCARGNGARRQLAALRVHGAIADVVAESARATLEAPA